MSLNNDMIYLASNFVMTEIYVDMLCTVSLGMPNRLLQSCKSYCKRCKNFPIDCAMFPEFTLAAGARGGTDPAAGFE